MNGRSIVLASGSPRRIELLRQWGVSFTVRPADISEEPFLTAPSAIVRELALRKALAVGAEMEKGLVIGADTIVVFDGDIIGKPADEADARRILTRLNGRAHEVYTGVAVADAGSGDALVTCDVSRVRLRRLSDEEIGRFSGKHLDKAGAYAVQEKDDAFVEAIEGDYFNVVGLPFYRLKQVLSRFGVHLPSHPQP